MNITSLVARSTHSLRAISTPSTSFTRKQLIAFAQALKSLMRVEGRFGGYCTYCTLGSSLARGMMMVAPKMRSMCLISTVFDMQSATARKPSFSCEIILRDSMTSSRVVLERSSFSSNLMSLTRMVVSTLPSALQMHCFLPERLMAVNMMTVTALATQMGLADYRKRWVLAITCSFTHSAFPQGFMAMLLSAPRDSSWMVALPWGEQVAVEVSCFSLAVRPVPKLNLMPLSQASKCLKLTSKQVMKYYSLPCSTPEYLRKDSTMDFVIYSRHSTSAPLRLSTMRQMAQLTAFLTSNSWSKSRFFSPSKVSLPTLASPSLVERSSPMRSVASLRMLTTLQWAKAEASPTHPCSIMLPGQAEKYSFLRHRWRAS